MKDWIKSTIMIGIGCAIFSFGVDYFLLANGLAEGGFTGIGLLLHYKFGWSVGAFFILSNIPLVLLGWRMWGWDFVAKTLTGVILSSVFLELFHTYQFPVDNLLLPALYGGLLSGTGLGLVIRFGGTTGGADIIARIFNRYFGISMGRFYLIFDTCVLLLVAAIHGLTIALYSVVTVFISSKVVDLVVDGLDSAKQALIISNHNDHIAEFIANDLDRGFTILNGRGGYCDAEKDVILCVVSRWEIFKLRKTVTEIDPHAFIIISNVNEAFGEGFKSI